MKLDSPDLSLICILSYHVVVASREAVHYEIINMCLSSTAHLHISAYVLEVTVCLHRH